MDAVVESPDQQSRLDQWAARLKMLQDKYGYVVGGVKTSYQYQIGEVIPKVRNWKNRMILESPTVVVGFSTKEEWIQQNSDIGCFDPEMAENYTQFLKLRADD